MCITMAAQKFNVRSSEVGEFRMLEREDMLMG